MSSFDDGGRSFYKLGKAGQNFCYISDHQDRVKKAALWRSVIYSEKR
jgi:hypothetical protein